MADFHFARHPKRKQKTYSRIGRFLQKLIVNPDRLFEGSPCWEWQGATDPAGYGRFKAFGQNYAHRVAYRYFIGEIPEGLDIDHKCRVRHCVSPFHLQAVTHAANKALSRNVKTHCINGHPYDEQNTGYTNKGDRLCKACRYEAIKRWRANHPEEARMVGRESKANWRSKGRR